MFSNIYEIHIVFSEITVGNKAICLLDYLACSSFSWDFAASSQTYSLGSINLVYDYVKLVGAFVFSGIQVKIIHGPLHIEQVSPANIHILCFSVLSLLFSLPLRLTLGFIVLPSSMAPVVAP